MNLCVTNLARYRSVLLVGLVCLLAGYGLGNLLPLGTAAKSPQLAYISNGYMHVFDLQSGQDTNLGNPGSTANHNAASPDGQWIASWLHTERSGWSLGILSTSTWQRTELGEFDVAFPTLSWSPDGKRIAFAAVPEGSEGGFANHELFLIDIESLQTQQLTDNTYRDDSPAFSPDGKRLAFTSSADGFNRLYVLDIATRESHLVTDQAFGYLPAWSLDGKQMAFVSNHDDRHNQVYIIDVDGTNLRRLTFNTATNEFPFWLP